MKVRATIRAPETLADCTLRDYPNTDAGGRTMIHETRKLGRGSFLRDQEGVPDLECLTVPRHHSVPVGNSSSDIIETTSYGPPVVNGGSRESGRERAVNVVDVDYARGRILAARRRASSDREFRGRARRVRNPYGDGHASERNACVLTGLVIARRLLQKRNAY